MTCEYNKSYSHGRICSTLFACYLRHSFIFVDLRYILALPAKNRLRKKKDFDRVFKEGNTVKGSFLFIKYSRGDTAFSRFGFIIPAKVFGKAVTRNRIKRVLSEIVKKHLKNSNRPKDMVIMVKRGVEHDVGKELSELLLKTN